MGGAGIIAADNTSHASDATINDVVIQWSVGSPEQTTQQVVNGFMAEASNEVMLFFGNADILASLGEVLNSGSDYRFG
jgi:hypothetical protein